MSLVIYGSPWCSGCQSLKSNLESKGVEYQYIDIDKEFELAQEKGIRSLPTAEINGEMVVGMMAILDKVKEKV